MLHILFPFLSSVFLLFFPPPPPHTHTHPHTLLFLCCFFLCFWSCSSRSSSFLFSFLRFLFFFCRLVFHIKKKIVLILFSFFFYIKIDRVREEINKLKSINYKSINSLVFIKHYKMNPLAHGSPKRVSVIDHWSRTSKIISRQNKNCRRQDHTADDTFHASSHADV